MLDQYLPTGEPDFEGREPIAGFLGWHRSPGELRPDSTGAETHVAGIVTGLMRSAIAERALAQERKQKQAFIATLAHELRQPLSTLVAAVAMSPMTTSVADANAIAEVIKRQLNRMFRLVEDLTDAARWATGKVSLRREALDIRGLVTEAAVDVAGLMADSALELVVETPAEPLWVDAGPQRLQQVFSNLLRNAAKYTGRGGRICLVVDRTATTVIVRIRDAGCGMAADALTHIFDIYTQLRPSDPVGLGLGLSIAREIITLHDGRIEAWSNGLGQGSEFTVTLPLMSAHATTPHSS